MKEKCLFIAAIGHRTSLFKGSQKVQTRFNLPQILKFLLQI